MVELELHDRLTGHGKPKMARLDDARMDRPDRNFEDPFAFNPSERMLPFDSLQDSVPSEVFFEWVGAFGPMFMTDKPAHVGMADRDQTEHVADLALIPFRRMDVRRDGSE